MLEARRYVALTDFTDLTDLNRDKREKAKPVTISPRSLPGLLVRGPPEEKTPVKSVKSVKMVKSPSTAGVSALPTSEVSRFKVGYKVGNFR